MARKLGKADSRNEAQFLRSVAELNASFEHKSIIADCKFPRKPPAPARRVSDCSGRATKDIQQRLWADLERIRLEYERLIHYELRLIRQRALQASPVAAGSASKPAATSRILITRGFAERFRGSEEYVAKDQRYYLPYFQECKSVLDIGCGRGEFLELMREPGFPRTVSILDRRRLSCAAQRAYRLKSLICFEYLRDETGEPFEGDFRGTDCGASAAGATAPDDQALRGALKPRRRPGDRNTESGVPGDLRDAFLYRSDAHQPIPPALLAFYFEEFGLGGIRNAPTFSGSRIDAGSWRIARGCAAQILRRSGLRDNGPQVVKIRGERVLTLRDSTRPRGCVRMDSLSN